MPIYCFRGTPSIPTNLLSGTTTSPFTPDPGLANKVTYMKCTSFAWRFNSTPSSLTTADCFLLTVSFNSLQSGQVTSAGTKNGRTVVGVIHNSMFTSTGPVLCSIPPGPCEIEFTVTRADGGVVNNSTAATMMAVLEMN